MAIAMFIMLLPFQKLKKPEKPHPNAKIIVHPECTHEVCKAVDGKGSTDS